MSAAAPREKKEEVVKEEKKKGGGVTKIRNIRSKEETQTQVYIAMTKAFQEV